MARAGLVLLGFLLAAPAAAQTPGEPPPAGAPVVFEGETLFTVHDVLGILTPDERAKLAAQRIAELADDPFYTQAALTIEEQEHATRILYDGAAVGIVTDDDAAAEHLSRSELAARRLRIIDRAVEGSRLRRRPEHTTEAAIKALVASGLLVLVLYGIRFVHRRLLRRVESSRTSALAARLEATLGLTASKVVLLQKRVVDLMRSALVVVLVLVYLQALFTILPPTRGYALTVLRYVLDPIAQLSRGLVRNLGNLVTIVVLVVLLRFALKALRALFYGASEGRFRIPGLVPDWCIPLYKIIRMIVIALGAVMIYPYVPGSDTAAFKGISLFTGALFTLGASGTIGNFVGGLVAIFAGAFRIGDWVQIGEVQGEVLETTMVLTRIRTAKNEIVTVPNGSILAGRIVNYSTLARAEGVILHTSVTIGYDAPWRTVHGLLISAAGKTEHLLGEPAPFVLQTALDDFYVRYEINAFTRRPERMPAIYADLHRNIQDAFNAGGVEIMSPHYTSLRDGNTVTIPEGERPEGYAPKPFGVRVEGSS